MITTPLDAIRKGLPKAYLEIEQPKSQKNQRIPVHFNPTEYQIQKQNSFADINIPGLETPPIQFIRGSGEKLTTELLVDTSDTLEDVNIKYVDNLRALMDIQSDLHAPPIVRFVWHDSVFRGVLESLNVTYVMFDPGGTPLRAKLAIALKEYKTVEEQINARPKNSPDVEKSYTVVRGDSLTAIAYKLYRDSSLWRDIAIANRIRDPRQLRPGSVLLIPQIR